jgi:hypothetical protein
MIRMTFGLGGLTCKAKRRNTPRGTGTFQKKARTSFDATIKFTFDFLWAIEAL